MRKLPELSIEDSNNPLSAGDDTTDVEDSLIFHPYPIIENSGDIHCHTYLYACTYVYVITPPGVLLLVYKPEGESL